MKVIFRNGDVVETNLNLLFDRIGLGPGVIIKALGRNEKGTYEIPFRAQDVLRIEP